MASSLTIFSIFAVKSTDHSCVCYCVFQGGTDMPKKDKSKGDPITMLAVKQLNESIDALVNDISELMKDGNISNPSKVELLELYNGQLDFKRKQVDDLTDTTPKTWDGIAMKAFTKR